jgi:hypothetical protein
MLLNWLVVLMWGAAPFLVQPLASVLKWGSNSFQSLCIKIRVFIYIRAERPNTSSLLS